MTDQGQNNKSEPENEKLLERLESSLQDIESREIVQGMTLEELRMRGFVGEKEITIERGRFRETTEREKLVFEEDVEYERLDDRDEYETVDIQRVLLVKDVLPGQVIATREPNESVAFYAGRNVDKDELEKKECYRARVKGKVLIIRDTLHVFPSDIDCSIKIRISDDGMQAIMDCAPGNGAGRELTIEAVREEIHKANVIFGILEKTIQETVNEAYEKRLPLQNVIVAAGRPPSPGGNADIDYKFDTGDEKQTFKVQPDGRIDYKGSASIPRTQKDQVLAVVTIPAEGAPGMNVLGKTIPAEKGSDKFLVAGKGVRPSP
ncbi:MAG: FapA family protein, partial [Chitinivibrionales bacterium]|nr:FapA family protein [Chitinivibrionales bacterium]